VNTRRFLCLTFTIPILLTACGPSVDISIVEPERLNGIESWAVVLRHPQSAAQDETERPAPEQNASDSAPSEPKVSSGVTGPVEGGVVHPDVIPGLPDFDASPLLLPLLDRIEFELIAKHGVRIAGEADADGLIQVSVDVAGGRYNRHADLIGGRITTIFIRLVDRDDIILGVLKIEAETNDHTAKAMAETAAKRIAEALQQF